MTRTMTTNSKFHDLVVTLSRNECFQSLSVQTPPFACLFTNDLAWNEILPRTLHKIELKAELPQLKSPERHLLCHCLVHP